MPLNNDNCLKDFLRDMPFFSDFSDQDLFRLVTNSHMRNTRKGESIVITGDKADKFYIVVSGCIKLFRNARNGNESILALIHSGQSFGKSPAFMRGQFPYCAESTNSAAILEVPSDVVRSVFLDTRNVDRLINKFMSATFEEMNQLALKAEHLSLMTTTQRVGCFLMRLSKKKYDGSVEVVLPYDKNTIASNLGMKPETLSRSLKQLSVMGVITVDNVVRINNIRKLRNDICTNCSATPDECHMAKRIAEEESSVVRVASC